MIRHAPGPQNLILRFEHQALKEFSLIFHWVDVDICVSYLWSRPIFLSRSSLLHYLKIYFLESWRWKGYLGSIALFASTNARSIVDVWPLPQSLTDLWRLYIYNTNDFIFRWLQLELCLMNPFACGISFAYVSALTKKICFNLISSLPNDLAGPVDVKLYKTEADTTGSSDNAVVLIQYVNNCADYHSPCCDQRWSVWGSLSCEAICSVLPVIVHINWWLHWNIGR